MTTQAPQNHAAPPAAGLAERGEASDLDRLLAQERVRAEASKNALEPNDYASAREFSKMIVESGMFTDKDGRPPTVGAIMLRIMTGRQLGISSTIALQHVYDLYGRVGISAALKRSLVRKHPECERYEMVSCSAEECVWIVKRKGNTEKTFRFTLDDAKKAQVVKKDSNWEKWARRMLQARASSEAADVEFPDAIMGLATTEEILEVEREPMAPPVGAAAAAAPARDWAKETAEITAKVVDLVARGEGKTARELYNLFQQEAPADWCDAVKGAYNRAIADAKAKAAAGTKAAEPTKGAPSGAQQNLTTPSATEAYLPPVQRGDAYQGPLEPPAGWKP
jgi:hypothetical protein